MALEDGTVVISRARATMRCLAHFRVIAATNPCSCEQLGAPEKNCV
ncbi:ATP-binding protein [Deinococcus sp. 6YEL10]|nr:ATP-binding protein [Deinococcus sp. 6YEL10]MCD0163367.1 ATP-binding protein [Deinococcus sp. 6YEL10]